MKSIYFTSCFVFDDFSDQKRKVSVDIITDATIYSVNNSFQELRLWRLMGKIVAIGTNSEISKQYESKNTIDGDGKFIYPLIDAHCHFIAMD
jgi:predicted amidohydrolase YtcJ